MARVRLTQDRLLRDFHDLLNAVADRIVVHGRTPDQAFNETVRAWMALLHQPRSLGAEKRIGLLGELSVMNSLADKFGWDTAVAAWKGPEGEEHDFGLPAFDIEVKSTAAETRTHTIHGLGQLTPNPDRPLWLVSVQITRGGTQDRTLPECINAVRRRISEAAPGAVSTFDRHLNMSGWSPDAPDDEHWTLRNAPLVLAVDEHLPRLEPSLLDSLPEETRRLVSIDQYRIDVTHLPASPDPPAALRAFRLP
ncbi:hypothetical protein STVIR_5496 [Streptomyces viridochromogenes Tue57]|uniref:PD-(D/E)XK motif protein n=2 Tax=Streptomyces viridochromogenes TaxID=1938 RepID=L8P7J3_STRVR|nr:hypothetical protein STVIR_5496 [Streptomyces viridochromogenes Tue57]